MSSACLRKSARNVPRKFHTCTVDLFEAYFLIFNNISIKCMLCPMGPCCLYMSWISGFCPILEPLIIYWPRLWKKRHQYHYMCQVGINKGVSILNFSWSPWLQRCVNQTSNPITGWNCTCYRLLSKICFPFVCLFIFGVIWHFSSFLLSRRDLCKKLAVKLQRRN